MRRFRSRWIEAAALALAAAAAGATLACTRSGAAAPAAPLFAGLTAAERAAALALSPLPPAPPPNPTNAVAGDPAAARLGAFLFHDTRLSSSGTVSCATCHDPARDFTSGTPRARGAGGMPTERNVPSLWNVAHQRWFFWDGRADTLWAQALHPILSPDEMGGSAERTARLFASDPELRAAYRAVFGAPPEGRPPERVLVDAGKAVEAFERTLATAPAPFDRFVAALRAGDEGAAEEAIPPAARRGLALFVGRGRCALCHGSPLLSDREFHNLGLGLGERETPDPGRFAGIPAVLADPFRGTGPFSDAPEAGANEKVRYVRQRPVNLGEFKTPSLRNVARTAPYMHDGRFATLEAVLGFYARLDEEPALGHREETLVPLGLSEAEIADLVAFLETLTAPPADPRVLGRPASPLREAR